MNRDEFLSPRSRYRGEFKPENLVFNTNLQEFAQRVSYITVLQTFVCNDFLGSTASRGMVLFRDAFA